MTNFELELENEAIKVEIKDMSALLSKSQGDMTQYTERQAKATAQ